jgi:dephospho-CoA kinase
VQNSKKIILAFVGMPGAGKSEAVFYLQKKGINFVRFGKVTDDGLKDLDRPLTPDNEKMFREKIRKELGMAAYAIKAESKINELLEKNNFIVIDGLYSWEEYLYLLNKFPFLKLILVYAEPEKRYERLAKRKIRTIPINKSRERDITEIQNLNKGGPIAIADFLIENNSETIGDLHKKIDEILERLNLINDKN